MIRMAKYVCDFDSIDRGVADIKAAAANMISILKNCVNSLNQELDNWDGDAADSIREIKEKVLAMLDSDRETFEMLGSYCQDASNLTEAAEDSCAGIVI